MLGYYSGYGMGMDSTYLLMIIAIAISAFAQMRVTSTFNKYLKVRNSTGIQGFEVARRILDSQGLYDIPVEMVPGTLSDHYDPRSRAVRLSKEVYAGDSIASVSVAAHEVGHAIQHATGYAPLNFRSILAPVAAFSGNIVWILVMMGLILSMPFLINIGIYLFLAVLLFQIITLPVEFNASKRALAQLESGYISSEEIQASKKVLGAAAMTYVAATLVSVLQLLRLLALSNRRRD
ncbi:zinc metallopeptidase [Microaceticoccus formicicus]|uniref:zinc metallopeptidase n=1 Tax=Microaceticoccus formicicus TaxID=3118105 RepID=UPI003CD04134|nr:zinc metallopeptidase [Peptoniphilaceae bacterium AMB_02]